MKIRSDKKKKTIKSQRGQEASHRNGKSTPKLISYCRENAKMIGTVAGVVSAAAGVVSVYLMNQQSTQLNYEVDGVELSKQIKDLKSELEETKDFYEAFQEYGQPIQISPVREALNADLDTLKNSFLKHLTDFKVLDSWRKDTEEELKSIFLDVNAFIGDGLLTSEEIELVIGQESSDYKFAVNVLAHHAVGSEKGMVMAVTDFLLSREALSAEQAIELQSFRGKLLRLPSRQLEAGHIEQLQHHFLNYEVALKNSPSWYERFTPDF